MVSELRRWPRYLTRFRATVTRFGEAARRDSSTWAARVVNVSAGGMQLALEAALLPGDRLRAIVPVLDGDATPVEAIVDVRWCRPSPVGLFGKYTCGAEFAPISQPGTARLLPVDRIPDRT